MKPEDQAALLDSWTKTNHHNGDHDWITYMLGWQAACAHRDAQPAVAVNEQLLEALKDLMTEQNGPPLLRRKDKWLRAIEKAEVAISQAEAAKGGL